MTKKEARKKLISLRGEMTPAQKARLDGEIIRHITESRYYINCESIFIYCAVKGEIDFAPLMQRAVRDGKVVALPICDGESLVFCRYDGALVQGSYGIPVPEKFVPVTADEKTLCIVPGLGYNRAGYRLGYGGGFYDRFLLDFPGVSVGAFYSGFTVSDKIFAPYDRKCDRIVTQEGFI